MADIFAWREIRVTEIAALTVGSLYVSGYYINSMFLGNLGITPTELIRLEYINIGVAFMLISFAICLLPLSAFFLTYRVRSSSRLPHFYSGLIGNSVNTTVALGFPLFLALFATRYEWDLHLQHPLLWTNTFSSAAYLAIILGTTGMIIVPVLERVVASRLSSSARRAVYLLGIEPIRFGIATVCVYLIANLIGQVSWVLSLLKGGLTYFACTFFMIGGLTAAVFWLKQISGVRSAWVAYGLVALGGAAVYYMTLATYVLNVYPYLPHNRGGALPLSRAYFEVKGHELIFSESRTIGGVNLRGPGFIIQEDEHTFFVASGQLDEWLTGFVPIHSLRKEDVPYVYRERIVDGFPRVIPHQHATIQMSLNHPAIDMTLNEIFQVRRVFQYDYIYFDALGLCLWLAVLWSGKERRAIIFGLFIAPLIYFIDAHIWWNASAGPHYPSSIRIREYWIGGIQMPHPLGEFAWMKFGADFMMTISYAMFTFPWLYIAFREIQSGSFFSKKLIKYTTLWFGIWMCVPLLSQLIHLNDTVVRTVRHMDSQFAIWLLNPLIGYAIIFFVYRRQLRKVAQLLTIGCVASVIMELPLYIFKIRSGAGPIFLLFEGLFLVNQGVPYLFLICDKVIPAFISKRAGEPAARK